MYNYFNDDWIGYFDAKKPAALSTSACCKQNDMKIERKENIQVVSIMYKYNSGLPYKFHHL